MANPRRKHSLRRTRLRRTHDKLTAPPVAKCSRCGQVKQPHRVCGNCGYYRDKPVLPV